MRLAGIAAIALLGIVLVSTVACSQSTLEPTPTPGMIEEHFIRCVPDCLNSWLLNGVCDSACNNAACGWDAGDCRTECSTGCLLSYIGDGFCDNACDNVACSYDYGDCYDDTSLPGCIDWVCDGNWIGGCCDSNSNGQYEREECCDSNSNRQYETPECYGETAWQIVTGQITPDEACPTPTPTPN